MGAYWGKVLLPGLIAALAFQALVGGLLLTPFLCCASAVWRKGHLRLARQWFKKKAFGCFLRGFCIGAGVSVIGVGVLIIYNKSLHEAIQGPAIIVYLLILPGRVVGEFLHGLEYVGSWIIRIGMLLQAILGGLIYIAIELTRWLNAQSSVREEQGQLSMDQGEQKTSQLKGFTIVLVCMVTIIIALGPPSELLLVAPLLGGIAVGAILVFWRLISTS